MKGLAQINRESIDAIREAVRELEQAGSITRSQIRKNLRSSCRMCGSMLN